MHATQRRAAAPLRLPQLPVLVGFLLAIVAFADGNYEVTLGSRVPELGNLMGISKALTGVLLGAFPVGLLIGGLIVAWLLGRGGTRLPLIVGGVLFLAPLAAIGWIVLSVSRPMLLPIAVLWLLAGVGCGMVNPAWQAHVTYFAKQSAARRSAQGKAPLGQLTLMFMVFKVAGFATGSLVSRDAIEDKTPVGEHFVTVGVLCLMAGLVAVLLLHNVYEKPQAPSASAEQASPLVLHKLGGVAGGVAVVLGGTIGWSTEVMTELKASPSLVGGALMAFCVAQIVVLIVSLVAERRELGVRGIAICGLWAAAAGALLFGLVAAHLWLRLFPNEVAQWMAISASLLLGSGTAPLLGFVTQAASNVNVPGYSAGRRIGIVVSEQYLFQGLAPLVVGVVGGLISEAAGASIGITAAFAGACALCVALLPLGLNVLTHATLRSDDQPTEHEKPAAEAPAPRVIAHGREVLLDVDATSHDTSVAPEELAAAVAEWRESGVGGRPEAVLVRLVGSVGPERADYVGRHRKEELIAALMATIGASPAVAHVDGVGMYDMKIGPTAVVTVQLTGSATLDELQARANLATDLFAGVAPANDVPIRRIILAVRVDCAGVETVDGAAPLVDLGLHDGTPRLQRAQRLGRAFAELMENAASLIAVNVVLACRAQGDLNAWTPRLLNAMPERAEAFGGAHVTGVERIGPRAVRVVPSGRHGVLCVQVDRHAPGAASITADALAGVGPVAVCCRQAIA